MREQVLLRALATSTCTSFATSTWSFRSRPSS